MGDTTVIGGITFIALKVKIYEAPLHHKAVTGGLSKAQFQTLYKSNEGFSVEYCGTTIHQSFSWTDLVLLAEDALFFGQSLNGC